MIDGGQGPGTRGQGSGDDGAGESRTRNEAQWSDGPEAARTGKGEGDPAEGTPKAESATAQNDRQRARPDQVFEPGKTFRARLIAPPSRRRSRAAGKGTARATESARGVIVGSRLPSDRDGAIAIGATLNAAAIRIARERAAINDQRATTGDQHGRLDQRATFNLQPSTAIPPSAFRLQPSDLRVPVRAQKAGHLLLFVVDASGSMAARKRMNLVKSTVLSLLVDAYRRRFQVGLIAFRGEAAMVLLPPTRSIDLAERLLRRLPTGGRTPLADGLRLADNVIGRAGDNSQPLLIVISDGRATAGLGGDPIADAHRVAVGIRVGGTPALVIDSEDGPVKLGLASRLAEALGAPCLPISALDADQIRGAIRWVSADAGNRP